MKTNISRRDFLRKAGISALAAGGLGTVYGCGEDRAEKKPSSDSKVIARTNLHNGDKVGLLGYGAMRWPMTKDEEGKNIVDQEALNALVDHALAHGINYFDSAPVYHNGMSETATGLALSRHPRESYYIATKMSNFRGDHLSKEDGIAMYRNSFKAFNTDYIDYYLLHSIGNEGAFNRRFKENGLIDFLMEERKAGRIRNLGFSFHGNKEGFDQLMALHGTYHWDFVQIQMNYMDWNHASSRNTDASYLYAELAKRNIPVVIMEPLLGGRLAKVPANISQRLKERNPQVSAASWAFRFAGSPEGVLTVLSGMTYMEHLQDNIDTFSDFKPMTDEELAFMEETAELMDKFPVIGCTGCQYCMPCPYGINIPEIFMHYNKCVNEGYISEKTGTKEYRKARRAYLISYDRAIPTLSQADRCIGCNQCVSQCPQNISIPRELHRIDRYIENLKRNKF